MSDRRRDPREAATRRPVPLGSLGRAIAGLLSRPQTIVLVADTVLAVLLVSVALPALERPLGQALGTPRAAFVLAFLGWVMIVLLIAGDAVLPPLLLRGRDRSAFAAHAWIGARITRRAFGRAARATRGPRGPKSAAAWLARTEPTDRNRPVRIEALVFAGQFDDARREVALLPEAGPLEAYRKRATEALIEDQAGGDVDESELQAAVDRIPPGIERTEAAVSLAIFRARRLLPDGDWRGPLCEVRPSVPGSDVRILVADFGLPAFELIMRRYVIPFTALILLLTAGFVVVRAALT